MVGYNRCRTSPFVVIPAKAGIQNWMPACASMTKRGGDSVHPEVFGEVLNGLRRWWDD